MRWLVTGATGFAGTCVVERLLAEGEQVVALCRSLEAGAELKDAGAQLVQADLSSPAALKAAAEGAQIVVHAAAETHWRSSEQALGWVNVAGTDNLVRACRAAKVRRLVHLSCADVTLNARPRMGWNEDKALTGQPLGHYARTKLAAEEIVIGGARTGFEAVALRPGWLWGAGDNSRLPMLAREALAGGVCMVGKGDHLFATTHVANLAQAVWLAGRADKASGAVYHVVDSEMVLAQDFLGELAKALGATTRSIGSLRGLRLRARLSDAPMHPDEVALRGLASSLDQQRVIRDLGYAPPLAMADGMRELCAWVEAVGGAKAIAVRQRPPATDADVAVQRDVAQH